MPPPKRIELGALYPVWGQNNYPQSSGTRPCLGVKDSVRAAAVMTVIELAGLLLVVSPGVESVRALQGHALALVPTDLGAWMRVGTGAFLAFFEGVQLSV